MKNKTLEALKGSIKKWYRIAYNRGVDEGCDNCPLCQLFWRFEGCHGCPVSEKTGLDHCYGTPYYAFAGESDSNGRVDSKFTQKLAIKEYKFLKSLLPENCFNS
jgi:hypothetical protein